MHDTMSEQNDSITILGGNVTEATPADYEDFWGSSPEAFGSWGYNSSPDTISFSTSLISLSISCTASSFFKVF